MKKEFVCNNCGKTFTRTYQVSKNYKHHFCDRKCESAYIKNKTIKNSLCANCGKPFHLKPSHLLDKNFCSWGCKEDYILKNGVSDITRKRMSESAIRKFKEHPELVESNRQKHIGKKQSKETIAKRVLKNTGKKRTPEQIADIKKRLKRGADNHFWKGGVSTLKHLVDECDISKNWKRAILKRDNFTCQWCGQYGERLEVHHKITFSSLLHTIIKENPGKGKYELFEICKKDSRLWDMDNGITLCRSCHKKTDSYGKNDFNNK